MAINPQTLFDEAKCYLCFEISEDEALELALLVRILNAGFGPAAPAAPTNLLIDLATTNGNVILNWTAASGAAPTSYEIHRSINGAAFTLLATIAGGLTTYTDLHVLAAAEQTYYEVRACTGGLCSSFTTQAGIFNGFTVAANTGTVTYSFPFLQFVLGNFLISNEVALTTVSTPRLRKVTGFYLMIADGALTSVDATSLLTCGAGCGVAQCNVITTVSFPALTNSGNFFTIRDNPLLTTATAPALTTVPASFQFPNTTALTSLSLPSLTSVVNDIDGANSGITSFTANALITIGGSLGLDGTASLTTLSMNSLTTIAVNLSMTGAGVLTTLNLPALTSVGDHIQTNNLGATSIVLDALLTIGGGVPGVGFFDTVGCPNLTSISMNALTDVGALGTDFGVSPNLVTVSWPNVIFQEGTIVGLDGDALDAATVNQTLARGVASGTTTADYELGNGTSAAPTGQGVIDKATLIGLGNTVNTN